MFTSAARHCRTWPELIAFHSFSYSQSCSSLAGSLRPRAHRYRRLMRLSFLFKINTYQSPRLLLREFFVPSRGRSVRLYPAIDNCLGCRCCVAAVFSAVRAADGDRRRRTEALCDYRPASDTRTLHLREPDKRKSIEQQNNNATTC